jgi:hypothetical protein
MHNVHDVNDYEDLLKKVLQHKILLLFIHVQINKDHIIHFNLLDRPLNKSKRIGQQQKKNNFFFVNLLDKVLNMNLIH